MLSTFFIHVNLAFNSRHTQVQNLHLDLTSEVSETEFVQRETHIFCITTELSFLFLKSPSFKDINGYLKCPLRQINCFLSLYSEMAF